MTKNILLLTLFFCVNIFMSQAQVAGDFKSKNAFGNWSDFNAWNIHNGLGWVAATAGQLPSVTATFFVQVGHVVTVDNAVAVQPSEYFQGWNDRPTCIWSDWHPKCKGNNYY